MVHGHRDYGVGGPTKIIHSVSDMGELAVRLGSPVNYDRSGNVLYCTDFQNGLGDFHSLISGTGGDVYLYGDLSYSAGICCCLIGTSDWPYRGFLYNDFRPIALNKMGFEVALMPVVNVDYINVFLDYYVDSIAHRFGLKMDITNKKFYCITMDGAEQELDDFDWSPATVNFFHTLKIVGDLETKKLVRGFYNENEFDLSDYGAYTLGAADIQLVRSVVEVHSTPGANGKCYIDNWVVTINEP